MKTVVMVLGLSLLACAQSSFEIAKRSYESMNGYKSSTANTTMLLQNNKNETNTRKMRIERMEGTDGDSSLITFLYPNDIAGTKLLSLESLQEDDKQWLYMPALKRTKRIASSNKSGAFMGSEFSYEDISSQHYEKFSYQDDVKKIQKNGVEYYELVRFPKDGSSGYSKQIVYLDIKTYLPAFGNYFDKEGRLYKEIVFLDYRDYGAFFRIEKMKITNVLNGKTTFLIWDEETIDAGLTQNDFHQRVLR